MPTHQLPLLKNDNTPQEPEKRSDIRNEEKWQMTHFPQLKLSDEAESLPNSCQQTKKNRARSAEYRDWNKIVG
jgi:hypothetical protein